MQTQLRARASTAWPAWPLTTRLSWASGGKAQNADEIIMLAYGNGELTAALGLELNGSRFGLGTRSQRFAMSGEDGYVTHLNI